MPTTRRQMLLSGAALAIITLPACQSMPGFSLTEAIRRLLTLASQNAFAQLLQPDGFWNNSVARIALPERLGGGGTILSAVLQSRTFRDRLQRQLNRAAEQGAERAAPIVADAIRTISFEDAAAIVRGGPRAATDFLRARMTDDLIAAMLPGIGEGLRLFDDQVINQAVRSVTGFDIAALTQELTLKADNAIWAAIGNEEAAIRADPRRTNDPLLIGVFGLVPR
jgi:hypothetical protein